MAKLEATLIQPSLTTLAVWLHLSMSTTCGLVFTRWVSYRSKMHSHAYQDPYLISPRWFCKCPGEFYLGRVCWLQRKYCGQQIDRMDKDSGVSTGTLYD